MSRKTYFMITVLVLLLTSAICRIPVVNASFQGSYLSCQKDVSRFPKIFGEEGILAKISSLLRGNLFQGEGFLSSYLLNGLLKSLLILFLAFLFWKVGQMAILGFSRYIQPISTRYPDFENRLSSYANQMKKAFKIIVLLLTALFLFQAWGFRVFRFLSAYSAYIYSLIRIPLILVLALLLIQMSRLIISKMERLIQIRMESRPGASKIEIEKQIKTIGEIIYKTVLITVWIVAVMMILKELGFDIKPILAGAGIVGLAVGFGAQNLVRDVISGLFMIIENQVRVGDVAILNGTGGLVEAVNLRTTVLRGLDGALHIFPNGTIDTLSNLTHNFSFYLFEIGVAYKEDVDRVSEILKKISNEIMADPTYAPEILEPLEILGLDKFGDSAIIIKARIKTKPIKQWLIGREMNRRIKKRFDEENIEIPFPHRTVYFGEASKPFGIRLEEDQESETLFKRWIREVLAEKNSGSDK
ncbi:MAG: mechanosensitive ion channel family protein [bacterium]